MHNLSDINFFQCMPQTYVTLFEYNRKCSLYMINAQETDTINSAFRNLEIFYKNLCASVELFSSCQISAVGTTVGITNPLNN